MTDPIETLRAAIFVCGEDSLASLITREKLNAKLRQRLFDVSRVCDDAGPMGMVNVSEVRAALEGRE